MRRILLPLLFALLLVLPAQGSRDANKIGATTGLPGVTDTDLTVETLRALAGDAYIGPPAGLPQYWFSSDAEASGNVTASTTNTVTTNIAGGAINSFAGMKIYVNAGRAKGQIRTITASTAGAAAVFTVTPAWDFLPAAVLPDTVQVFTGELIPGTLHGSCTRDEPCLDLKKIGELANARVGWVWLDSGDNWDTANEWCTNTPAGRCTGFRGNVFTYNSKTSGVEAYPSVAEQNQILFAVSGTDFTGKQKPVINCDTPNQFPIGSGTGSSGTFEVSTGQGADGGWFNGWVLVQNLRTVCWNVPAPTGASAVRQSNSADVGIFRSEGGSLLINHTEHGEITDFATVVSIGSAITSDERGAVVYAIDVRANLANTEQWNSQCTGADNPFIVCSAAGIANEAAPELVRGQNGGSLLWVGGNWMYKNLEVTADASNPSGRAFFEYTPQTVNANTSLIFVNTLLADSGDEPPFTTGFNVTATAASNTTTTNVYVINSGCFNMKNSTTGTGCILLEPNRASGNTAVKMNATLINAGANQISDFFIWNDESNGSLGGNVIARCIAIDEVNNSHWGVQTTNNTIMAKRFFDVQGLWDGDDAGAFDFNFSCGTGGTSAAFLASACFGAGNPGTVNNWQFFQTTSGELAGVGVDSNAYGFGISTDFSAINQMPYQTTLDPYTVGYAACTYSQTIKLPLPMPVGSVSPTSAPQNLVIKGRRHYGVN